MPSVAAPRKDNQTLCAGFIACLQCKIAVERACRTFGIVASGLLATPHCMQRKVTGCLRQYSGCAAYLVIWKQILKTARTSKLWEIAEITYCSNIQAFMPRKCVGLC